MKMTKKQALEQAEIVYRKVIPGPYELGWQERADLMARMAQIIMFLQQLRD